MSHLDPTARLAALLADPEAAARLRELLPAHLWPVRPFKTDRFGSLLKYTLGEAEPGVWVGLHCLSAPDAGPAGPHDHSMDIDSTGIQGSYWERVYCPDGRRELILRAAGGCHRIHAETVHEVFDLPEGACWTLVRTGALRKDWRHFPELVA